jgi:hypothetical protein
MSADVGHRLAVFLQVADFQQIRSAMRLAASASIA